MIYLEHEDQIEYIDLTMGSRQDNHGIDTSTSQIKLFIFDLVFPLKYINISVAFMLSPI